MNLFKKKKKKPVAEKGKVPRSGISDPQTGSLISSRVPQAEIPGGSKVPGGSGKKAFTEGLVSIKDVIAPSAIEVDFNHLRINNRYYRTLFVAGYPRFVSMNWLSTLINFDHSLNVAMYVYPTDGKEILDDLRRKIAEMEAELSTDLQRGKVINPSTKAKLEDALSLQEDLVKGEERFFQFGLYVTVSAETKEELDQVTKALESSLGALLIITKKASLQMEEGFKSTLPICNDLLNVARNMDTTSLATTFPFVSSDLSDDKGIMYGINEHNGSLVIFDRFEMENYNSVIFATSGAGKSYLVKLEALRSLMFGSEILIIDPENEYETLCEAVGGQYISFGYDEESKINPFELSVFREGEENELARKILSLHALFKIIMGKMNPEEEAILDRALVDSYKMKGITPDPETQDKEPPLIEDLYKALIGREEKTAKSLAARLERFIKGSMMGVFNSQSTVDMKNKFVVFGIKNLEESLRPMAMHVILDYIWNRVRKDMKKRLLIVDEAWLMMRHEDSADFLYGITKRARKYFLGVTTVTQDVDDFLNAEKGKAIVTNSALRILLKQHTAAIDQLAKIFYLSEGEKQLLLSADIGEGIFFAGQNHVAIRVIASPEEHELITSKPEDLLRIKAEREEKEKEKAPQGEVSDSRDFSEGRKEKTVLEGRSANVEITEETPQAEIPKGSEVPGGNEIPKGSEVPPQTGSLVTEGNEIPKGSEVPPQTEPLVTDDPDPKEQGEKKEVETEAASTDDETALVLEKRIAELEEQEVEKIKPEEVSPIEPVVDSGLEKNKDLFTGTDSVNLTGPASSKIPKSPTSKVIFTKPVTEIQGSQTVPEKTETPDEGEKEESEVPALIQPSQVIKKQSPSASKTTEERSGFDYSKIAQEVWGEDEAGKKQDSATTGQDEQSSAAPKATTGRGKIGNYDDLF